MVFLLTHQTFKLFPILPASGECGRRLRLCLSVRGEREKRCPEPDDAERVSRTLPSPAAVVVSEEQDVSFSASLCIYRPFTFGVLVLCINFFLEGY